MGTDYGTATLTEQIEYGRTDGHLHRTDGRREREEIDGQVLSVPASGDRNRRVDREYELPCAARAHGPAAVRVSERAIPHRY